MASIDLREIRNFILRGINLSVEPGELVVILGPTGSGKTTMLNVVAGLCEYEGQVMIQGRPVEGIPTRKRNVGYLFQDLVLFPHMDVGSNILFGLEASGWPREDRQKRVKDLAKLLNIESISGRYPKDLSGGEKQRAALARALAPEPRILLLDEPFNSLDVRTAKRLRLEYRRLQRKLGMTTIFVSHNLTEAEEMADRIAVLQGGILEQIGPPDEVLLNPYREKGRDFIGSPNVFDCQEVQLLSNGLLEVHSNAISIVVPYEGNFPQKIAISPWDVYISCNKPPGPQLNRYKGTIQSVSQLGSIRRLHVDVDGSLILAEVPEDIYKGEGMTAGREVHVILKIRSLRTY